MTTETPKRIPYGKQNWEGVRLDNCYYVDKTRFIAESLHRFSSQRDKQKGEAYVHGFTLAQTCLTNVYLPISELDTGPVSGLKSEVYSLWSKV